jgi:adenine-specific DNA-methyltransferase
MGLLRDHHSEPVEGRGNGGVPVRSGRINPGRRSLPPEDVGRIETERRLEQDRIDRLKGADERNRLGQFATPNALAVAIARSVQWLWGPRSGPVRFLDPSIGSGSFFSALLQVFPDGWIGPSAGIELDRAFAETASRLWGPMGLEVVVGDFTRLDPPLAGQRANLVMANPPYVRHHHLDREEKRRLKDLVEQRLGIKVSGLAGLYAHFLLLCDAWLEDGGLAVWLIPSEFMDVNYGSAIKVYLTEHVRLLQIHRFKPSDVQFRDALVTSAIVIFEKLLPEESALVRMSLGGSLEDPAISEQVSLADLRAARKWTNYPRVNAESKEFSASSTTLGDLFTIRRGLATGSNGFFILPRDEAVRLGLPPRFLRPILPGPKHLVEPIIEADAEGHPALDRPLVLLDCDRPEEEIQRDHPTLWAYYAKGVSQGLHEGYLTSRRTPWYSQEHREPPPFVCTYMGRQRGDRSPFRIFWNKSRAIAANVYLLLYPKGPLQRALATRPELYPILIGLLQEIRSSDFIDEGRVYGGGLHKMEPKELSALPADAILAAIGRPAAPRQATLVGF